jgi:hypothetical protein
MLVTTGRMRVAEMGGGVADLDIELEWSPILNDDGVGLVWCAYDQAEFSIEYLHQRRLA